MAPCRYTNLYANAANAATAVNPSVYSNTLYANWTKKHEPGSAGGQRTGGQALMVVAALWKGCPIPWSSMICAHCASCRCLLLNVCPTIAASALRRHAANHFSAFAEGGVAEGAPAAGGDGTQGGPGDAAGALPVGAYPVTDMVGYGAPSVGDAQQPQQTGEEAQQQQAQQDAMAAAVAQQAAEQQAAPVEGQVQPSVVQQ